MKFTDGSRGLILEEGSISWHSKKKKLRIRNLGKAIYLEFLS